MLYDIDLPGNYGTAGGAFSSGDSVTRLTAKVDAMLSASAPSKDMTSPSVLGGRFLKQLANLGSVVDFAEGSGPSVLTDELQEKINSESEKEEHITHNLTETLWDIVSSAQPNQPNSLPLMLVNSEMAAWLDHLDKPVDKKNLQKPDFFVSWEPFIKFSKLSGTPGHNIAKFLYGGLAHRSLQLDGCVPIVLEGKKTLLDAEDFADMIDYHSHLPGRVNGVLFNNDSFWLTKATDRIIYSVVKCRWTQLGTRSLLQQHFSAVLNAPPLADLLSQLVRNLNVKLVRSPDRKSCFLGAGGSGRVFTVQDNAGQIRALKVVANCRGPPLRDEFTLLDKAARDGAPVIPPVLESLTLIAGLGGGYLLANVGLPITVSTRDWVFRVFESLRLIHEKGLVHGDARVPNVIDVDGEAQWVDFIGPSPFFSTTEDARNDMKILTASVLRTQPDNVDKTITSLIDNFPVGLPGTESASALQAVVTAVWAKSKLL